MNVNKVEPDAMTARAGSADDTAVVRVEKLVKCFGHNRVLDGIDLVISRGEVVSLMGRSGGGKTTLLRCLNLLEEPPREASKSAARWCPRTARACTGPAGFASGSGWAWISRVSTCSST